MNCPECNAELIDLKNGYYQCPYDKCPLYDCLIDMRKELPAPHLKEMSE
jgi:hypothetical protein